MQLREYPVLPQLQPFVKGIYTMGCDGEADTSHIRVLPDTCTELFLNYTDSPLAVIGGELYPHSMVSARMNRPMEVQLRKGAGCMAICFYPGVAYRFFHVSMHLLANGNTPLAAIWEGAGTLEERLANANDNAARVTIVQQHLVRRLADSREDAQVAACLALVRLTRQPLPVKALCAHAGISQRHLARKFAHCLGLSPGEYLVVSRFMRALALLKRSPARPLTDVALESGYYDQAHFIRDCHTFSGHAPGALARSPAVFY